MQSIDLAGLGTAITNDFEWTRNTLRSLVEIESPTAEKPRVDLAMRFAEDIGRTLGGRVKWHKQKFYGDVLELRFGPTRSGSATPIKPVLLLGHLDTVWAAGTLQTMPWREVDGRFFGPGVLDMKAGVVMAFAALRALGKVGRIPPVRLLLNSEEEVGSPVSRPITERVALESSAVLVLEPAQGLACKTARKGVGDYRLEVTGVASHSGVDFERGHSAVLELARLLRTVEGFTDLRIGRTVNPGVIGGGTRANVIAQNAWAEIDVRLAKASDAVRVDRLFRGLRCSDPACSLQVTGGMNRPPMERKAGTIALYKRARGLAAGLGFELAEAATGGGSDGNFTAALGVPTLDGLGAVGEGAHAAHESVVVSHLVPRTALLAALIGSVAAG